MHDHLSKFNTGMRLMTISILETKAAIQTSAHQTSEKVCLGLSTERQTDLRCQNEPKTGRV